MCEGLNEGGDLSLFQFPADCIQLFFLWVSETFSDVVNIVSKTLKNDVVLILLFVFTKKPRVPKERYLSSTFSFYLSYLCFSKQFTNSDTFG